MLDITSFLQVGNDMAVFKHNGAFAVLVYNRQIMRDHQDRCAVFAVDLVKQRHDFIRHGRVKVSGRLVRDQNLRTVGNRTGNCNTLLLTAGKLPRKAVSLLIQADEVHDLAHTAADQGFRKIDDFQRIGNILKYRLGRQELEVLEDNADIPAVDRDFGMAELSDIDTDNGNLPRPAV